MKTSSSTSTKMTFGSFQAFAVCTVCLFFCNAAGSSVHAMQLEDSDPAMADFLEQRRLTGCAIPGMRSQQCGAIWGGNRPVHCCPGLSCDGGRCYNDPNKVPTSRRVPSPSPTARPTTSPTQAPTDAPTAAPTDAPTAAPQVPYKNKAFDILETQYGRNSVPTKNKNPGAGGLGSVVFGDRENGRPRTWDMLVFPSGRSHPGRAPSSYSLQADPNQDIASLVAMESDPFQVTDMPTSRPTVLSAAPSSQPTTITGAPSATPSTSSPTVSPQPTQWHLIDTLEPNATTMKNSYFSYNPDHPRGPANWGSMKGGAAPEAKYWEPIQDYIAHDLNENMCNNPNSRRQSPIDVRFENSHGQCFEYHEIRHQAGHISVADPRVDAKILPTKLRIDYPYSVMDKQLLYETPEEEHPDWTEMAWLPDEKTGKLKLKVRDAVEGPSADIPKGWGYQLPVTHVDIKMPSEHWMEGKQYAAEYQLYLIQNLQKKRGAPAISVLIDFDEWDRPNYALQTVLDRFQVEFDKDKAKCEEKKRQGRRLGAIFDSDNIGEDQSTWLDEPEEEQEKFRKYLRRAQQAADWAANPFQIDDGAFVTCQWVTVAETAYRCSRFTFDGLTQIKDKCPTECSNIAWKEEKAEKAEKGEPGGPGDQRVQGEPVVEGPVVEEPDLVPSASPTKPPTPPPQGNYTYFDPWDSNIFRSIWFFGYEGSLTEPPCTEFVEWRIIDTPTTMSKQQFKQMQNLLFNHVDKDCNPTSANHQGSVARPLQPYNGRMVHRCMCRDFISDKVRKGGYHNQRCTWGETEHFGFDRDQYSTDWYERTHRYEEPDHQSCALFGEKCDGWNQFLGNRDAEYILKIQDRVRRGELAEMRLAGVSTSAAELSRAGASDVSDTAAILSGASGSAAIPSGSPTATAMPVDSAGPPINTFSELLPGLYPETLETIQKKVAKWEEMERMPSGAPSSHAPSVQPSASPVAFSLP